NHKNAERVQFEDQLPGGLLVARCLADEALHARAWLIELWRLLRPALLGREAVPPRIWST
ncbi:hypothetical protein DZ918_027860, partial [Pseudomonas aeruginosa]|nr:hypothetical protein [Pseudomonas aeruginosa]